MDYHGLTCGLNRDYILGSLGYIGRHLSGLQTEIPYLEGQGTQ